MKKAAILILLLTIAIAIISSNINGMEYCGIEKGIYLNVNNNNKVFKMFQPIETLTNGYIQVDCE